MYILPTPTSYPNSLYYLYYPSGSKSESEEVRLDPWGSPPSEVDIDISYQKIVQNPVLPSYTYTVMWFEYYES